MSLRTPECGHPDRPHGGHGLCNTCYTQTWRLEGRRPRRPARTPECHPDRKHEAHGLCKKCYREVWIAGWKERTKDHRNAWSKSYWSEPGNAERRKTHAWKSRMKRSYGITPEEFEKKIEDQHGRCLVCLLEPDRFVVDHDHDTGKVRGLLCDKCNRGLGQFKDDPMLLSAAAEYIAARTPMVML